MSTTSVQPDTPGTPGDDVLAYEHRPLAEMVRIALPAVVSMTSYTAMQFVDKAIATRLSASALAGASNGGVAVWVLGSSLIGVLTILNTLVSQNLGAGKPERGSVYAWQGLWISAAAWLVLAVPGGLFFGELFAGMRGLLGLSVSERVAADEAAYGRVLMFGLFFLLASRTMSQYFYGMHKPGVVLASALSGNAVNVLASLALAFGWWGLPRMEVAGLAMGTVIGSAVECLIPVAVFLSRGWNAKYLTRAMWRPALRETWDVLRLGWPGGVMFGNEMVCWWVFTTGYTAQFDDGREFPVQNSASWIAFQYMHLSFMPAVGLSIAVTALVGKYVGAKRPDLAKRSAWLGLKVAMVYMALCALVFVLMGDTLISWFTPDKFSDEARAEMIRLGAILLVIAAIFQTFDAVGITMVGALRGAGDVVWPGVMTMILSWSLIIGLGWVFVRYWPSLGAIGPWVAAAIYIITFALVMLGRFVWGPWRHKRVVRDEPTDAAPHPIEAGGPVGHLPGTAAITQPDA